MRTFADELESYGDAPALISPAGEVLSYAALAARADAFAARLGAEPRLLYLEAAPAVEPIAAYLGALRGGHATILAATGRADLDAGILERYRPDARYGCRAGAWELDLRPPEGGLHPDLAVLLSTSGSTGSAKLVRLSGANLTENARSIADYLGIDASQRPITSLPWHYSYGLSVLNSHFARGAAVVLTDRSVAEPEFWEALRRHGVTSFAGVPYTFELLDQVGFAELDLPSLQYVTQAGGRLPAEAALRYGRLAQRKGFRLFVMYGQTEATARIAYLPPDQLLAHPDCIGIAIPRGELRLEDEGGERVEAVDVPGELVYRGPNVMLGYAERREDLARGAELDALRTGDLACRNAAGLYRIVGRKSRFSKLFGLRINLDDVERFAASAGYRAIAGGDDQLLALITLDPGRGAELRRAVAERFGLPPHVVWVLERPDYPLLASGKVDYPRLARLAHEAAEAGGGGSIRDAFQAALGGSAPLQDDLSFIELGGDSLTYVSLCVQLERCLGYLPPGWERQPLRALEALPRRDAVPSTVEVSVLLRALAIAGVVANHTKLTNLHGAAFLLLLVSGANFARFQGGALSRGRVLGAALPVLRHILIPYEVVALLYLAFKRAWEPSIPLLYGNFLGPDTVSIFPVWFIQVLVQCIVFVSSLFLLAPVRAWARRDPWRFGLAASLVSLAVRVLAPGLWDTEHLYNRVPHMLLWLFFLGFAVQGADTTRRRLWTQVVLVASVALAYGHRADYVGWLVGGGTLLLWRTSLRLPRAPKRVVTAISAAIFHIYLTHMVFYHPFRGQGLAGLAAVTALAGGVGAWYLQERVGVAAQRLLAWSRGAEARAPGSS